MKTSLSIVVALLLLSVSVAQATPIRGTFTGVVTYNSNPTLDLPFLEGTPARAIFGYETNYLMPPDAFGNRYVFPSELPDAGFWFGEIGGVSVGGFNTYSGSLLIGPNGLPASGNGIGLYDYSFSSNAFSVSIFDLSTIVTVEGTYSLPDHEATLPLTLLGLAALAVSRRFL